MRVGGRQRCGGRIKPLVKEDQNWARPVRRHMDPTELGAKDWDPEGVWGFFKANWPALAFPVLLRSYRVGEDWPG